MRHKDVTIFDEVKKTQGCFIENWIKGQDIVGGEEKLVKTIEEAVDKV